MAPLTLKWAVRLLGFETVAVVAAAAYEAYETLAGGASNPGLATFVTWYAIAYGIGFGVATWGLARRQRWSRTPALVLNLFLLPIGYFMTQEALWWLGLPIIAYALVVAWLLVSRPTREALGIY